MRQRINIAVAVEMDADDLSRIMSDTLLDYFGLAVGNAVTAMVPRSVEAIVAATRVNVSPPYTPEEAS